MTNMMQYLIKMADDFRDSYIEIDEKMAEGQLERKKENDEILDILQLVLIRVQELETRINNNRKDE
tara:strand:+ start:558 stop:755 length:198 start_codon:yes stop_codon:yes gene_type:complete